MVSISHESCDTLTHVNDSGSGNGDVVELRVPATSAYLTVLRSTTAGLAARLNFTLDDIDDLRIAVDEACAILLEVARPDTDITCVFELASNELGVDVSVAAADTVLPSRETFAWTVLSALTAGNVSSSVQGGRATIMMRKKRR
jgi:serine/threonine-protein kinase RsbW